ncbi:MAG: murein biosynthesis integral membrane protein MurJ [Actinobacteria bacterium]|nr:MAG: murein biosynthesis integral membrane protein MurJ [Actinomycetota bacterium]
MDSREATVRNAAVMSGGTLLSRVTGLLRVTVTLAALGFTVVSDGYNAANTTPNIIYELVLGGILTSVFVPALVGRGKDRGREAQFEAASRFLTIALVLLTGVAVLGAAAAPWIMRLYLGSVDDPVRRTQEVELGTFFLRWFMPQIVFYGVGAVAGGLLTANRRFAAQMYAPVLNNIAVIATMFALIAMRGTTPPQVGTITFAQKTLLGAGTTLGVLAMTAALWPALRRIGFRWRLRWDWRHETVRQLFHLARWVVVYVVANQVAYLIIIRLASKISAGAYTAYSQAFVFFSLPHAIVAVSIFTALIPGMAERWTGEDRAGVRELFSRGFRDTMIVMIPAAAGYLVLAGPIVALLAGHGAVRGVELPILARILAAFAIGLPFFSAFQLMTRTLCAMHDSRTPAVVNIGVAVVNIAADLLFAFAWHRGVTGLALGHAVSYVFGSAVLFVIVRRRLGGADDRRVGVTIAATLLAAGITAAAAAGAAALVSVAIDVDWTLARLIQVTAGVAAGVLVFLACALIFGIHEVDEVKVALLGRPRRGA